MEKQGVVLFGTRASSDCTRVELALKLKGIPYEYVEEDLTNKSELLLHFNPFHKNVPVLVHKDKPITESLVILEYIDDCWNNAPKLLTEDPYEKARARSWANFYDQKLMPSTVPIIILNGKAQEAAKEEFSELLGVFEEGVEKDFPQKKSPFFNGDTLGFLDIVVGSSACNYKVFQEAIGVSIDLDKHPAFFSWVTALIDYPMMKETLPPHDTLVAKMRERFSLSLVFKSI
ncbi:hypothetical protein F0562_032902 [Nyssa sinensis]|uniref:Glutathione S-transferase n=1 Tax=Nyssa sinensis TaxID=561372 RepID=A0A5J5AVF2_9ASTE|nr:hypothetical protein F0562_032902 [Nyssa sinensis]